VEIPRFHRPPKEWGIYVQSAGRDIELKDDDLEMLDRLRVELEAQRGDLLTWKVDIPHWVGLRAALDRLWRNGYVDKYATTLHTQSDRPQYISWWIWRESNEERSEDNLVRNFDGLANYLMPGSRRQYDGRPSDP